MMHLLNKDDIIFLDNIPFIPPVEQSTILGFIKHVQCEGAKFHVMSYGFKNGKSYKKCSEKNCIQNYEGK